MPQSLAKVLVHLVYSTKNRERLIPRDLCPQLYAYLVGILGNLKCPSIQTGGMADHMHVFFRLGRTVAVSDVAEEVKKSSSKWMKIQGVPAFAWQAGYGAFSVSQSAVDEVRAYIQNQRDHHRVDRGECHHHHHLGHHDQYQRVLA